ncbi:MAG: tripartite tricarboxylate transporter permease [Clostridia bacterium]|nr:tripartite tricarboxylate transporter permease [Clostridia bacterium]
MFAQVMSNFLVPLNWVLVVAGVIVGMIFGAIPGLSATTCMALMLPLSFTMAPEVGIIFLGSIYVGGVSGSLISAILLGIPGQAASIATCFDGYPMAKKEQASRALGVGILSSFIATVLSVLVAMLFCPTLARWAVKLGPWESFSLCFCAIILVVTLSKGNMFNGLIAGFLGMFLSTVGISPIDGALRFTFGNFNLISGLSLLAVMLGVFAMGNLVRDFAKNDMESPDIDTKSIKGLGLPLREYFSHWLLIIKSWLIGLWIGFLPGMGAGLANIVAYSQAKASSKHPEKFGTGCDEGIIASEVSNNAAIGGAIIPMIALGIPGDSPTALLLSGLMVHGIDVGPLLMTTRPALVYCFFAVLLIGAIVTFVVQMGGMRVFPYILKVPSHYLYAAIFLICFAGIWSDTKTLFAIGMMIAFAVLGVVMGDFNLPMSPFILGFILGPMLEKNLRMGLTYTDDGFLPFITRPVSGILLLVAFASLFWPMIRDYRAKKRAEAGKTNEIQAKADAYEAEDD